MIHIEVTSEEDQEERVQMDNFPSLVVSGETGAEQTQSKLTSKEDTGVEVAPPDKSKDNTQDNSTVTTKERSPVAEVRKEQQQYRVRKERRPQSLNLGMSTEFVYEKEGEGSDGEEESDSDKSSPLLTEGEDTRLEVQTEASWSRPKDEVPVHEENKPTEETRPRDKTPLVSAVFRDEDTGKQLGEIKRIVKLSVEEEGELSSQGKPPSIDAEKCRDEKHAEDRWASEFVGSANGPREVDEKEEELLVDIKMDQGVIQNQRSLNAVAHENWDGSSSEKTTTLKLECTEEVRGGTVEMGIIDWMPPNFDPTEQRKLGCDGQSVAMVEGLKQEKSERRPSYKGTTVVHSEIMRIVPLKPERSKNTSCKEDKGKFNQQAETNSASGGTTVEENLVEGSGDRPSYNKMIEEEFPSPPPPCTVPVPSSAVTEESLCWQPMEDREPFQPELQAAGNLVKNSSRVEDTDLKHDKSHPEDPSQTNQLTQSFGSKASASQRNAPPTPPVKTQKARESGLILRNSRIASKDPNLEAAKKRNAREPWERRPGSASEDDQDRETLYMKETHLGIERKCSSITVSSTSSLEAEVDFTVIMDLHTGMEEFSRGMSELGERDRLPEVGRDDFEETSRFYSARLMASQDKSPVEDRPFEERVPHEPPVAKKDASAVSAAQRLRKTDSKTEMQPNGAEVTTTIMELPGQMETDINCQEAKVPSADVIPPAEGDLGYSVSGVKEVHPPSSESGSPGKMSTLGREAAVSPLTVTTENVTSATTTHVTKTVKGGYSETRIEKRIIITGDDDVDQDQALAMAIQEAKQQHPDMLVTKAVVVRETESSSEEKHRKSES
ncbi:hypothetical protein AGOR_G00159160 [Albula goreensis]|uniref:Band 4.1 C-terminal domain-containing protein n=1 Tax=Albula goreensis TaxID=1534307 RepID=A0A8T3D4P1_9TELE|nr:hypothetical protein AGOR_G00159160 [Albula goreensis]